MKKHLIVLLGALLLTTSCSLVPRKEISERRAQPKKGSPETVSSPYQEDEEDEAPRPVPQKREAPKVAVVLGPGGFKTFAYASLVKSLQQSGVPTDMIVGVEWGALVGGIWALNGQPHEAEWKVFKLEDSLFSGTGFFKSKNDPIESANLRKYLGENLTSLDLKKLKVPFTCPTLSLKSGTMIWPQRGSLAKTVENCLVSPPEIAPSAKSPYVASLFSLTEIAKRLKREGFGVIILVNVLGDEDFLKSSEVDWVTRAYWLEARRALWAAKREYTDIIDINTSAYELFDIRAKKGLSRNAEAIGQKVGRELVEKYKF